MQTSEPVRADGDVCERWRPVPGYLDLYEVSNMGMVRSVDRIVPHARFGERFIPGRILTQRASKSGAMSVALSQDGRSHHLSVGRLVLEAFTRAPDEGEWAAHINGDIGDNRLSNLRWELPVKVCEMREGRGRTIRGEQVATSRLTAEQVAEMRDLWLTGRWSIDALAERFDVHRTTCQSITDGRTWARGAMAPAIAAEAKRRADGVPPLSTMERRALNYIEKHPGTTQATISAAFGRKMGNLGRLYQRGLVRRWKAVEAVRSGASGTTERETWHYAAIESGVREHGP